MESIRRGDDLCGHNLHKITLTDAHLEKARLSHTNLSQADLSGSHLFDFDLKGADLVGADLSGCELSHCDLKNADLTKASLADSRLWNTDLRSANLTEADLSNTDLRNAKLGDIKLWHATLTGAKSLTRNNFSGENSLFQNPKINEDGLFSAEESYRDLKSYFLFNGMYNDASWASFKEKTIERGILRKNRDPAYFSSLVMSILCGYGEKPYRIILSSFLAILTYALVYGLLNAVRCPVEPAYKLRWIDYLYYSTVTFTTVGYGDFIPKHGGLFRFLAASEAFAGVFLTGLFIFTLARKYSAR
jgi:hypothetical protein